MYVHHKPNADGSNPRSGKPAERRWFGRKSRLSAFSFKRAPRGVPPYLGRPDHLDPEDPVPRRPGPDEFTCYPYSLRFHQSACAHPVELEAAVNDVAAGGPFGAVGVCLQPGQFTRIHETGIDIWARRVYVHCTPEADGSNPERGRSAERRRVWGQTWSCRRSALSPSSRARISARPLLESRGFDTRMIGVANTRTDVRQSRISQ